MRGKENPTHVIALLNLADAYATIVVCSKHVQFQSQLFLISITVVDDALPTLLDFIMQPASDDGN